MKVCCWIIMRGTLGGSVHRNTTEMKYPSSPHKKCDTTLPTPHVACLWSPQYSNLLGQSPQYCKNNVPLYNGCCHIVTFLSVDLLTAICGNLIMSSASYENKLLSIILRYMYIIWRHSSTHNFQKQWQIMTGGEVTNHRNEASKALHVHQQNTGIVW